MKKVWRVSIALVVTALVVALMVLLSGISRERSHLLTCNRIDIRILDSARLSFIGVDDVKKCLEESYGVWNGQRLDSVNLRKIETVLRDRSAILTSEAWTTGDGVLHIAVTQREPIVRFQGPDGGFYSDEKGFLFPLQAGYTSRVPIIDGAVPVTVPKGFKGRPEDPKEQLWLDQVLNLIRYISHDKTFKDAFSQITVLRGGDYIILPLSRSL